MAKRMAHITVRADYGGAPNYINTMINNTSPSFDIYIACPKDEPYYNIWRSNKRVKDLCVLPHRKFSVSHFISLIKFIKKNKIELIQANGKGAGSYRFLKIFCPKVKVLYAYRGFHIHDYSKFQRKLYFIYERIMVFFTNRVINVSKGEQQQCINHKVLKKRLSAQIYNGINPLKLKENRLLKEEYKDKFVISTLSRFDIQKNMGLMYDIAWRLKSHSDIKFIFIGDGEDKSVLEKKAQKEGLKNIDFVGFKNHDEIAEYFTITDLYLTTARWEGLPFALVEATSVGLPIVASDVVGNNEVCLNNQNGLLFPSEDAIKAVEAILQLYTDREMLKSFGLKSSKIFQEYFTVVQMVANHEKLYEEVLDGS